MWLSRTCIVLLFVGLATCEKSAEEDASSAFLEAAQSFFADKDAASGLQGMASAFIQSNAGKQVSDMMGGKSDGDGVGQIISGIGSLFGDNQGGVDTILGSIIDNMVSPKTRSARDVDPGPGIDFESIMNMGSLLLGQSANSDVFMGLVPMLLQNLGGSNDNAANKHDHSGHSWFLPPVLEHIHVMWDHFSNSELGQALWRKSGLSKIIEQMSDDQGRLQYEKILDSFESPSLRRRWIKSLTNYVAEWISHISDPVIQQRYLATVQFVGNSFLKSQGYPKQAMFESSRPTDSLARLTNAVAKRHLGIKFDSSQYIRPAVAYFQELIALASDKGFIMSRINARELSNRLSEMINNDVVGPVLKAYRAYKWATKMPQCANQILCTINEGVESHRGDYNPIRIGLLKLSSFPAAWAVSNKLGTNFWTSYAAINENDNCIAKYPMDCTAFHEEEIRVNSENVHSEL